VATWRLTAARTPCGAKRHDTSVESDTRDPGATADVRSNEEGVLGHPMKDLRNVRLRLRQVQLVELLPLNGD